MNITYSGMIVFGFALGFMCWAFGAATNAIFSSIRPTEKISFLDGNE